MRPFENLFLFFVLAGLMAVMAFGPLGFGPAHSEFTLLKIAAKLIALIALLFLLHAVREAVRWQLAPAYLSFLLLASAIFFTVTGGRAAALRFALSGILCWCASCLLCWLLPMFRFAALTGPHQTGTSVVAMTDASREDVSPSGRRELMVQFWYPAEASRNPIAPYRRKHETTRVSSYQSALRTRSRMDAPLVRSKAKFPILLFNPAWNGRRTQNTFLVEELASHGFVVAAIDHTDNSEPVAFPDGRVVMARHVRAMEDVSTSTAEEVQRIGNTEVERQVLDNRFVLDQLAAWNEEKGSRWYQRLDPDRAGALGHSLGGATAIECWATDPRILAAMNMDGWTFGHQVATGRRRSFDLAHHVAKPLLFIYEGKYEPFPDPAMAQSGGKGEVERQVDNWDACHIRDLLQHHGGYWLKLQGADHMNFTDRTISSPLRRLAGGGEIDARRAHRILRDYAVSFFKQSLLGVESPLLDREHSSYPEIEMRHAVSLPDSASG